MISLPLISSSRRYLIVSSFPNSKTICVGVGEGVSEGMGVSVMVEDGFDSGIPEISLPKISIVVVVTGSILLNGKEGGKAHPAIIRTRHRNRAILTNLFNLFLHYNPGVNFYFLRSISRF